MDCATTQHTWRWMGWYCIQTGYRPYSLKYFWVVGLGGIQTNYRYTEYLLPGLFGYLPLLINHRYIKLSFVHSSPTAGQYNIFCQSSVITLVEICTCSGWWKGQLAWALWDYMSLLKNFRSPPPPTRPFALSPEAALCGTFFPFQSIGWPY